MPKKKKKRYLILETIEEKNVTKKRAVAVSWGLFSFQSLHFLFNFIPSIIELLFLRLLSIRKYRLAEFGNMPPGMFSGLNNSVTDVSVAST